MSALARYFHSNGIQVAGYDRAASAVTAALEDLGIQINYKDDMGQIDASFLDSDKTLVVYTPAIPENHQQFNYFKSHQF